MSTIEIPKDCLDLCREFWKQKSTEFREQENEFNDHLSILWQLLDAIELNSGRQAVRQISGMRSKIEQAFDADEVQRKIQNGAKSATKRLRQSEKTILKSWTYGSKMLTVMFRPEKPFGRESMQNLAIISKHNSFDEARELLQQAIEKRLKSVEQEEAPSQTSTKNVLCPCDIRTVAKLFKKPSRSEKKYDQAALHNKNLKPHPKRQRDKKDSELGEDQNDSAGEMSERPATDGSESDDGIDHKSDYSHETTSDHDSHHGQGSGQTAHYSDPITTTSSYESDQATTILSRKGYETDDGFDHESGHGFETTSDHDSHHGQVSGQSARYPDPVNTTPSHEERPLVDFSEHPSGQAAKTLSLAPSKALKARISTRPPVSIGQTTVHDPQRKRTYSGTLVETRRNTRLQRRELDRAKSNNDYNGDGGNDAHDRADETSTEESSTVPQRPKQGRNSYDDDEKEVLTYFKSAEAFAISKSSKLLRRGEETETVHDEAIQLLLEIWKVIGTRDDAHWRSRVDRHQAKRLYQQDTLPAVVVVRDDVLCEDFEQRTFQRYVDVLEDTYDSLITIDVAQKATAIDTGSGSVEAIPDLVKVFRERQPLQTIGHYLKYRDVEAFVPPCDSLNLKCTEQNIWPNFLLQDDRYRLLKRLDEDLLDAERTAKRSKPSVEKPKRSLERVVDFTASQAFTLLSQADSISLTHHDHHGQGTMVRVVDGKKLWVWWEDLTEEERTDFRIKGSSWVGRRPRWALLSPGDILIMRAGAAVPHFVVTLEDSLCFGGAFWDQKAIPGILDAIREEQMVPDLISTNEENADQLPLMLAKLEERINQDNGRYDFGTITKEKLDVSFRMPQQAVKALLV